MFEYVTGIELKILWLFHIITCPYFDTIFWSSSKKKKKKMLLAVELLSCFALWHLAVSGSSCPSCHHSFLSFSCIAFISSLLLNYVCFDFCPFCCLFTQPIFSTVSNFGFYSKAIRLEFRPVNIENDNFSCFFFFLRLLAVFRL